MEIIDNPHEWLPIKLLEHLRMLFPNVKVLHQITQELEVSYVAETETPIRNYKEQIGMFQFEVKDIYNKAVFHGTSNYILENKFETKIAMRSHQQNKTHQAFVLDENENLQQSNFYDDITPSEFFLQSLANPRAVPRGKCWIKKGILKLNYWRLNHDKWIAKHLLPGDSFEKAGLLRELSLSQFSYRTIEQFLAIKRESEANKRRYGQTYEGYFINPDGTLDYQEMIVKIDEILATGAFSINKAIDPHRNRRRKGQMRHPEADSYDLLKKKINVAKIANLSEQVEESNVDGEAAAKVSFTYEDDEIWF